MWVKQQGSAETQAVSAGVGRGEEAPSLQCSVLAVESPDAQFFQAKPRGNRPPL